MHDVILLHDLSVVMIIAAGVTILCHWLKQPVVLGYIIAGLIIGPHTPPSALIKDQHNIGTMAELGLVFLMFALGLEFNLPKLRRVGPSAAVASALEILGMTAIGYMAGRFMGWDTTNSLFLGIILSMSSTTIIIKVFNDLKLTQENFAQLIYGILILEDIAAVIFITLLSGLGASGGVAGEAVAASLWKVTLFTSLFLIIGLAAVPPLMHRIQRLGSRETLGISTLGLCLGGSLLAHTCGFSVALGAFLIGSIIGVSRAIREVEEWIHPLRDMFSAIFFVSAGMLLDPKVLVEHAGAIVTITLVTIVGKIAAGTIGAFAVGYNLQTSLKTGMGLAQIGEFSFVLASLAVLSGRGAEYLYPLAVAVSAITTLTTPYLIRKSDVVSRCFIQLAPKPLLKVLDRYHAKRLAAKERSVTGTTLYSRYLLRLGIYAVILIGVFLALDRTSAYLPSSKATPWLWAASYFAAVPLILAVAYYLNHFFLLAFTEALMRWRQGRWLQVIPIHQTYRAFEGLAIGVLSLVFFIPAWRAITDVRVRWVMVFGVFGGAWLCKRLYRRVYLALEELMDQVVGRATSEPLRPAALTKEGPEEFLQDTMEKVLLTEKSPAIRESLRSFNLRGLTGVNVIAIYRRGSLLSNPNPELTLAVGDILVILGDADERTRARDLLKSH